MKIIFFLFPILLLLPHKSSCQDNLAIRQTGSVKKISRIDKKIILTTGSNLEVQLSAYSPRIVRVRIAVPGVEEKPSYAVIQDKTQNFNEVNDTGTELTLLTDSLKIVIRKSPLLIDFYDARGQWLDGDAPSLGVCRQGEEITSYRKLTADEKFIGLGEKTGPLNRRELSYVNWNTDAFGYAVNADPIYSTMPYFMGIHSGGIFGIFFDNTYKTFFNFGASTDGTMYSFGAEGGEMNYYFFGASDVAEQIKDYTWLTGRMQMPPLWSLGYQQSRYSYMSREQLLGIARKMRQDSIPCDVIYCDIDYMNGYRVFTWNPATYPDPKSLTDSLHSMNFHLVTIIDPGIKIDSNNYQPYLTGIKNKYFARYPDGKPYTGSVWAGRSHLPDFTRDVVRKWWGENFKVLVENGVTGFWNDMNEPAVWGQNIPPLILFGEEKNPVTLKGARNIYGMQMARATFEGTRTLMNGKRPFILTRAAYSGIQRYSAMWTGDNNPTDEHMLLGYRLINSMGLTGEAFDGVDVGGFSGNPTPELMLRWMSLGVYTPMFRNHTAKGNTSHEPWAWGELSEILMRHFIQTRYRLLPYIYSSFYEATQTGMPVSRTLAISYTHHNEVFDNRFENEFLFGPFMLVAPVASTKNSEQVYLPSGTWYRSGTDRKIKGDTVIWAASPLKNLPVFIKAGAIIPMQSVTNSTAEPGDGIMYLNIWYGDSPVSYSYYEDDGTTYQYLQGKFYKRIINFNPGEHEILMDKVQGDYPTRFHSVRLIMHGFPANSQYRVNGQSVNAVRSGGLQTISFINENSGISIKW